MDRPSLNHARSSLRFDSRPASFPRHPRSPHCYSADDEKARAKPGIGFRPQLRPNHMNGAPQQNKWPETAPYNAAIDAFDAALTRAGYDKAFRTRLTASPASAKAAIAELGNFTIPEDRVIVF